MKPCSRCGLLFRAYHGNQLYCGSCRQKRSFRPRISSTPALGVRICAFCRMPYQARAVNQRYCSKRCKGRAKPAAMSAKYARPSHRLGRKALKPAVATGLVRCARGERCKFREWVDGELVGGFIRLGQPWDLGHRDEESVGGPEHRECNRGAPSRRLGAPPMSHGRKHRRTTIAFVYGDVGEPVAVLCDPEGDPPGQRYFTIVLDDSPGPDSEPQAPVCVDCLLDDHPRLGPGLLVAVEHRGAEWRDGERVPAPELWDE